MKTRRRRLLRMWTGAVGAALTGLAACSADRDLSTLYTPDDVGTLVVDALLIVHRPLPEIRLSRAARPDVEYDPVAAAEIGATVRVIRIATSDTLTYSESDVAGHYLPDGIDVVQPEETYLLSVFTTQGEPLSAVTTTPAAMTVTEWVLLENDGATVRRRLRTFSELDDSVYFAPENQLRYSDGLLEGRLVRPDVPGFQVGISSLDLDSGFVIDPDFFEEDDFADIDRDGVSPALEGRDGEVRLPWLAVAFAGRHVFRVFALDRNAFDLVRTLPPSDGSAFAFGGNLGDNFERPTFYVQGGIGLFGSATADSVGFFVLPAP